MADELGYDPDDGRVDVDAIDEVPVGAVIAARAGRIDVAVARLASGRVVVVEDACPHDGRPISEGGFVDGDRIVCPRHGWELAPCRGSLRRCA
jgi:phenylpropionate dioxygenase-like ring-hydroxylating dioxygenase large terminal subunit